MKRILLVDDEPAALEQLQEALRPMQGQYEMEFLNNGPRALERMFKTPFDVVVADVAMPGMDGAQLLTWIMRKFPQAVRIAMAEGDDAEASRSLAGVAHQLISKPCAALALREAIERALASRQTLDPRLKQVVSQLQALPSAPGIYLEMVQELRQEEPSIPKLASLISRDLGLTAKVLQLINSAYFALRQPVNNPSEAIFYLGIGTVKNLVLGVQAFSQFTPVALPGLSLEHLWQHSWHVGMLARQIVNAENRAHLGDEVFTAGLLHDLGKLVLASGLTEDYRRVLENWVAQPQPLWRVEKQFLGATHAEVGAYLLGLWGLPAAVVDGVGFHHRPAEHPKKEFTLVTALHAANALEHECDDSLPPEAKDVIDMDYIAALGFDERVEVWRKVTTTALAA